MKMRKHNRILYCIFLFAFLPPMYGFPQHVALTRIHSTVSGTVPGQYCKIPGLAGTHPGQTRHTCDEYIDITLPAGFVSPAAQSDCKMQYPSQPGEELYLLDSSVSLYQTQDDYKNIFTYNAMGLRLTYIYQKKTGTEWENVSKESYSYDEHGNRLSFLYQQWNNGSWLNYGKTESTYDENNNLLTTHSQSWNGISWQSYSFISRTYNANNSILTERSQRWQNGQWIDQHLNKYSYDPENRLSWVWQQGFNGNSWINLAMKIFTYYQDSTEVLDQQWNGNNWQDFNLDTYTKDTVSGWEVYTSHWWNSISWVNVTRDSTLYDASRNMLCYIWLNWDEGFSIWSNKEKYIYTYDNQNNLLTTLQQKGQYFDWFNYYLTTSIYDGSGLPVSTTNQQWINQGGVSSWVSIDSLTNEYNADHNLIIRASYTYNGSGLDPVSRIEYTYPGGYVHSDAYKWAGGNWLPADESIPVFVCADGKQIKIYDGGGYQQDVYYSSLITSADPGIPDIGLSISAFPDPADDMLTLRMNFDKSGRVKISLMDISGKPVSEVYSGTVKQGENVLSVSMKNEKAGLYLLNVQSQQGSAQLKVCIVH